MNRVIAGDRFAYDDGVNKQYLVSVCMQFFRMCREAHKIKYTIFSSLLSKSGLFREKEAIIEEKVQHNRFLCSYTFLHKQFACALNSLEAWIYLFKFHLRFYFAFADVLEENQKENQHKQKYPCNLLLKCVQWIIILSSSFFLFLGIMHLFAHIACMRMVTHNHNMRLVWFMSCRALQRKSMDSKTTCK